MKAWTEQVKPKKLDLELSAEYTIRQGARADAQARYGISDNISVGAGAFATYGPQGPDAGVMATLTGHF